MTTTTAFRCYYDDGTISDSVTGECPTNNANGSPLIKSELQIIEDVIEGSQFPWWLLILVALAVLTTKER